ncbi:putative nuclease harbi1 [Phtheirospermum japonicum]|uniref:Putative nuclease harbi1 n=1 Tax=Phtheirospermum japonicum TaxID=374723 RepID=A0A830BPT7_9LAMI|nr:putative nuclease harbi1 [Phtheirospermum japonicum]
MNAFDRLCYLLESVGGLLPSRDILVSEQVALFLSVLAHHQKNRVVKHVFSRSGQSVSKHFHLVLDAVLRLHLILAVTPKEIDESCTDINWKWFKGCLGALDGTFVQVQVPLGEKPRYRNRKGDVAVNVLGVCDQNMNYIFVLTGWEGSAADSRVLRDAITRRNCLKIPNGRYYLCDGGYTNGPGFLAPYRGVRYHLNEWKKRWAILRSPSFYDIVTQNKMIMACCLLHNFIPTNMAIDPIECMGEEPDTATSNEDTTLEDYFDQVQPSQQWTDWRDTFAAAMYEEWRATA